MSGNHVPLDLATGKARGDETTEERTTLSRKIEDDDDMDDWLKALTPAKVAPFKSKVVLTPVVFMDEPNSEDEPIDVKTSHLLDEEGMGSPISLEVSHKETPIDILKSDIPVSEPLYMSAFSFSNDEEVVELLVDVTSFTGSETPSSFNFSEPCSPHVASPLQDIETLRANDAALQQLRADLNNSGTYNGNDISDTSVKVANKVHSTSPGNLQPSRSLIPKGPKHVPVSTDGLVSDKSIPSTPRDPLTRETHFPISIETSKLYPTSRSRASPRALDSPKEASPRRKPTKMTMSLTPTSTTLVENKMFGEQHRRLTPTDIIEQRKLMNKKNGVSEWSFIRNQRCRPLSAWDPSHKDQEDAIELKRIIQVAVRVRPFTNGERQIGVRRIVSTNGDRLILVNPGAFEADPDIIAAAAVATSSHEWAKEFRFDHCLWSYNPNDKEDIYIDQEEVFKTIGLSMADRVMKGGSVSCFAYGHTGTGKTHTMFGSVDDTVCKTSGFGLQMNMELPMNYGLIPRVFCDVVNRVLNDPEVSADTKITISFVEIHNEKIQDLLSLSTESCDLKVRERPGYGSYIENVAKVEVITSEDVLKSLKLGLSRRTVGSTSRNTCSSRSHALVILELTPLATENKANRKVNGTPAVGPTSEQCIRIQMVDLAGSEQEWTDRSEEKRSSHQVQRDIEAEKLEVKLIRKSLSTLGYIIKELSRGVSSKGLPYRDSILTWLLKESLSGGCHTTMVSTISPSHICFEETLSTLKYTRRLYQSSRRHSEGSTTTPSVMLREGEDINQHPLDVEILRDSLGAARRGSVVARNLLRDTIVDPQQRLAKLNPWEQPSQPKVVFSVTPVQARGSDLDMTPLHGAAELYNFSATSVSKSDTAKQQAAIQATNSPVYNPNFKEAYRVLQGQFVELQINLEDVRTDRDTLLLELQSAKSSAIANIPMDVSSYSKTVNKLTESIRAAEDKQVELRDLVIRKEEKIDALLVECAKGKDDNAELRHQVSNLLASVDDREAVYRQVADDNAKLKELLQTLLQQNVHLKAQCEMLTSDLTTLRSATDSAENALRAKTDTLSQQLLLAGLEKDHIQAKFQEMVLKQNDTRHLQQLVVSLKDELSEAEVHKLQAAANYEKIKIELTNKKSRQHELYEALSLFSENSSEHISVDAWTSLERSLESLRDHYIDEYESMLHQSFIDLVRSCRAGVAAAFAQPPPIPSPDITILEQTIAELEAANKLLSSELKSLQRSMERRLQKERDSLAGSASYVKPHADSTEEEAGPVDNLIADLAGLEDAKSSQEILLQEELLQEKVLHEKVLQEKLLAAERDMEMLRAQLDTEREARERLDLLFRAEGLIRGNECARYSDFLDTFDRYRGVREENTKLKEELNARDDQLNVFHTKHDADESRMYIEKEYASLWLAVGELNKLDAEKEQAIADLMRDRDEALTQRDMAMLKVEQLSADYNTLHKDIQEIDNDLYDAVRDDTDDLITYVNLIKNVSKSPGDRAKSLLKGILLTDGETREFKAPKTPTPVFMKPTAASRAREANNQSAKKLTTSIRLSTPKSALTSENNTQSVPDKMLPMSKSELDELRNTLSAQSFILWGADLGSAFENYSNGTGRMELNGFEALIRRCLPDATKRDLFNLLRTVSLEFNGHFEEEAFLKFMLGVLN